MGTIIGPPTGTREDLQALVLEAFRRARGAGKSDWWRMAIGVLKNRMLDLTDRRFDERDYGAQRFTELLSRLAGIVAVDRSVKPPIVELLPDGHALLDPNEKGLQRLGRTTGQPGNRGDPLQRRRVRSDLWNAVLDYSSGTQWRWNAETSTAEPAEPGDVPENERLPTITASQLAEWRHRFIKDNADDVPDLVKAAAVEWAEFGRASDMLPQDLRGRWFECLKLRVIETLECWFAERDLKVPADVRENTRPLARQPMPQVEELREFIVRCVRTMSAAELGSMQLPAEAVMRTSR